MLIDITKGSLTVTTSHVWYSYLITEKFSDSSDDSSIFSLISSTISHFCLYAFNKYVRLLSTPA